jgi:hypothetical protein
MVHIPGVVWCSGKLEMEPSEIRRLQYGRLAKRKGTGDSLYGIAGMRGFNSYICRQTPKLTAYRVMRRSDVLT